ncbi:MAG: hypothetical protein FJ095_15225, partial [Deltaproteobacteria bacterium]|nr:hypothetical protein [Deltaproteobacteria bacterium]
GEACDDGNLIANDGCSEACAVEGSFSLCPGGVTIDLADRIILSGSTVGIPNITETNCGGKSAGDAIYAVIPSKTGSMVATMKPQVGFNAPIIAFRTDCKLAKGTEPYCKQMTQQLGFQDTLMVTAGKAFYVVVTGTSGSAGAYTLELDLL